MKRKDLSLIFAIVFLSALVSFFISNTLFNKSRTKKEQVEVVQPISAEFATPDKKYFNGDSVNPTQLIEINPSDNTDPF